MQEAEAGEQHGEEERIGPAERAVASERQVDGPESHSDARSSITEEALGQTLGSFCPNVLFPYAREAIDSIVTKGSFPPLMLAPVNFDAIYAQAKARTEAETAPIQ